jgi:hypothetical protein
MKHTKAWRKQLWLAILLVSCFLFGGCPGPQRSCEECATIEFNCENNCATVADNPELIDCVAQCDEARAACDANCVRAE